MSPDFPTLTLSQSDTQSSQSVGRNVRFISVRAEYRSVLDASFEKMVINQISIKKQTSQANKPLLLIFFLESMSSIHMEQYPYDFDPHDASHLQLSIPPTGAAMDCMPMDHVGTNSIFGFRGAFSVLDRQKNH